MELKKTYFNFLYNPIYDFTTARLSFYQRLQEACIGKLEFNAGDKVLCVGVGTGNEINRILDKNAGVQICGVDFSNQALKRAYKKASKRGLEIIALRMDAQKLDFADESFDKVVCIHVMGFITDDKKATDEIIRVLRRDGQFVITYPSGSGGLDLLSELMHSIRANFNSRKYGRALGELLAAVIGGIIYIPGAFFVKPGKGFYSTQDLKAMFDAKRLAAYQLLEDHAYQDFIVYGKK